MMPNDYSKHKQTAEAPKRRSRKKAENLNEIQEVISSEVNTPALPEGNVEGPSEQEISSEHGDKTEERRIAQEGQSTDRQETPALSDGNQSSAPDEKNAGPSKQLLTCEHKAKTKAFKTPKDKKSTKKATPKRKGSVQKKNSSPAKKLPRQLRNCGLSFSTMEIIEMDVVEEPGKPPRKKFVKRFRDVPEAEEPRQAQEGESTDIQETPTLSASNDRTVPEEEVAGPSIEGISSEHDDSPEAEKKEE